MPFSPVILLVNGLTLTLALGFLLILLWYDLRSQNNQFFGAFLLLVVIWNLGALFGQVSLLLGDVPTLESLANQISDVGYAGASVALYVLITVLLGIHPQRFRLIAFLTLALFVVYNIGVLLIQYQSGRFVTGNSRSVLATLFVFWFDIIIIYNLWRFHRKIRLRSLMIGILLFVIGQIVYLLNPTLGITSLAPMISALGVVILSFAMIRMQIIQPLWDRNSQVSAMHEVSLAITSQLDAQTVFSEIAQQMVQVLQCNAAAVFLLDDQMIKAVAQYQLPAVLMEERFPLGTGISGRSIQNNETLFLENFSRDWEADVEIPYAKETFGSVICTPLTYQSALIGALMVVSSRQGRLFTPDDVALLERLGAQAAVALGHAQIFSELRETSNRLNTVLNGTANPVVAINRQLEWIFLNPMALELMNLLKVPIGEPVLGTLPPEALPPSFKELLRATRQKHHFTYEFKFLNKNYLCYITALGDVWITGWVAVLHDITQLRELDRMKSEMVRMATHDLKNPLQAAMSNLELLQSDLESIEDDEIHLSADNIDAQLTKMTRIIQGILDIERVNALQTAWEVTEVSSLVSDAVDELYDFANLYRVAINVELYPGVAPICVDSEQFKRVLVNLIENAIKFSLNPDTSVKITVSNQANEVLISIADEGIGIPEEMQPLVFDRFYRGKQKGVEHVSGTGLGLSLVKAIVENHKGRIWFESVYGQGTTFYVSIPAAS